MASFSSPHQSRSQSSQSSSPPSQSRRGYGATPSRRLITLALAAASVRSASAALTLNGCYSSSTGLSYNSQYNFQSSSYCNTQCGGAAVIGLEGGYDCYCGSELPPADTQVDASNCNVPCTGYGQTDCGGNGFYTVYTTDNPDVPHAGGGGSSSSSDTTSSAAPTSTTTSVAVVTATSTSIPPPPSSSQPSTTTTHHHHPQPSSNTQPQTSIVTEQGQTIVRTVGPTSTASLSAGAASSTNANTNNSSNNSGSSSTPVAGIAAGVTIGVLAFVAIVGGLWWFLRRRRRMQSLEDYPSGGGRHQVSEFMRGNYGERKPPSTAYSQMSDSRMEPQLRDNRNSVGSIMDNQDYSRRILRVANPDSS